MKTSLLLIAGMLLAWTRPLPTYTVTNGYFACALRCYHLADDVDGSAGDIVQSIGDGTVVDVRYRGNPRNYGGFVAVEHEHPWLGTITAIYGHLGPDTEDRETDDILVTVGEHIREGRGIGRLGTQEENGGWSPHLHFGIHRGPYDPQGPETADSLLCGSWRYAGYTALNVSSDSPCFCQVFDQWADPGVAIAARPHPIQLTYQEVVPREGFTGDDFVWNLFATGWDDVPLQADVIVYDPGRDGNDGTELRMAYEEGTRDPYRFHASATLVNEGDYFYQFRAGSCGEYKEGPLRDDLMVESLPGPPPPPACEAERCDNADNDCDGRVDEELTRGCPVRCNGVLVFGGSETCTAGRWINCSTRCPPPPPPPVCEEEMCDGLDNNCDGMVDEDIVVECRSACGEGLQMCGPDGALLPCDAPQPRDETCDGADNDCDGQTDEGLARVCMLSCGDGSLREGMEDCAAGGWNGCTARCPDPPPPPPPPPPDCTAEVCDNADNDCDDAVDNGLARSCFLSCPNGESYGGSEECSNGRWNCDAVCPACSLMQEVCGDGRDNNCNGRNEEGCAAPPPPPPPPPPATVSEAPQLRSPGTDAIVEIAFGARGEANLGWEAVGGAASYEYRVRYGGWPGNLVSSGTTAQTSVEFAQGASGYGIEFSWKVRGVSANGEAGPWSPERSFFLSYPVGSLVSCVRDCPSQNAWYRVSRDTHAQADGPDQLILDWISEACINGRTATRLPFDELSGYFRSARFNGCPP